MTHPALLATRYARRPLLLEPGQAQMLLNHLQAGDPRGLHRETRLDAVLRRVGIRRPRTQDHVDDAIEEAEAEANASAARRPTCYYPLWARQKYGEPEDEGFAWTLIQGIACMEISTAISDRGEYYCGVWYHGYDTILAALREASADARVKGIFILHRTPGGVVADGLDEVTNFMREARASAGGKPIHVYASMSCSGGYWIGAPADRISSSRFGLVGSIGACIIHENWTEGYKKAGLVVESIEFGEGKTDFASWKPVTPEARAHLKAEIDQVGRDFVESVSTSRPQLTPELLLDTKARVFMTTNDDPALSGLALGFVDAIESEQEAFEALLAKVSTPQGAETPLRTPETAPTSSVTAQTPEKEKPMAGTARKPAAQAAAAAKAAQLKADRAKIDAELAEIEDAAAPEGEEASDSADQADDEDAGGEDGDGDDDQDGAGEPADGDKEVKSDAEAIASSPEAKANPAAAVAAINSGLSLSQFKAMSTSGALASTGKRSPLAEAMEGKRRLGADARPAGGGSALLASAKRMKDAARPG